MLAEHKKKRKTDKKQANLITLGSNGTIADNRDGQTTYLKTNIVG
jgi:hypothetical protein